MQGEVTEEEDEVEDERSDESGRCERVWRMTRKDMETNNNENIKEKEQMTKRNKTIYQITNIGRTTVVSQTQWKQKQNKTSSNKTTILSIIVKLNTSMHTI